MKNYDQKTHMSYYSGLVGSNRLFKSRRLLDFLVFSVLLLFSVLLFFTSCEDKSDNMQSETGDIRFGVSNTLPDGTKGGRQETSTEPAFIVYSIELEDGTPVETLTEISLIEFGEGYITEPVGFLVNNYVLTEFLVLNDEKEVIYATPVEGSALSSLVSEPLPIPFQISADNVETIIPEVLTVEGLDAEDFGYVAFGFQVTEIMNVPLAAFLYNDGWTLTEATLEVTTYENGQQIRNDEFSLYAGVNTIIIQGGDNYDLTVRKEGFQVSTKNFTHAELDAKDSISFYLERPKLTQFDWYLPENGPVQMTFEATYDENGNLSGWTGQLFHSYSGADIGPLKYFEYEYDGSRIVKMSLVIDGLVDNYLDYIYDAEGNLEKIEQYRTLDGTTWLWQEKEFTYNSGMINEIKDFFWYSDGTKLGENTSTMQYDASGNIETITFLNGNTVNLKYDNAKNAQKELSFYHPTMAYHYFPESFVSAAVLSNNNIVEVSELFEDVNFKMERSYEYSYDDNQLPVNALMEYNFYEGVEDVPSITYEFVGEFLYN